MTYSDDLDADQLRDAQEIGPAGDAEEEGDGVADVAQDQLDGEVVFAVQVDVAAPPGQETVDQAEQGDDAEQRGHDHAGDLETEPGAVGEGVEGVGGLVLVVGHDDFAGGKRFFDFGVAQLAHCDGGGDRHHTARDEDLRVHAHADIGHEDGTGDGRETGGHDLVQLGGRQVGHKRLDEHGALSLSDERRRGSDHRLGT